MGCASCHKSDYGKTECTASRKYRDNFCEVVFDYELPKRKDTNLTPKKKKKRKI